MSRKKEQDVYSYIRSDNKKIIESYLEKYNYLLKYDLKKEEDLHELFTDLYLYHDFKELTFKLVATLKKEEQQKKAKTVQLFHFGARLKKEFITTNGEAAETLIKDKIFEALIFTNAFKMQQHFKEIDTLLESTISLKKEASKL